MVNEYSYYSIFLKSSSWGLALDQLLATKAPLLR